MEVKIKKKKIIVTGIILVIILSTISYKLIIGNEIKNKAYKFLEIKGYTKKDIDDIEIKHSFINKILSYNEWRIFVEFESEEDIIFAFTYRNNNIIIQEIKCENYQLTKEEIQTYQNKYESGELKYNKQDDNIIDSTEITERFNKYIKVEKLN